MGLEDLPQERGQGPFFSDQLLRAAQDSEHLWFPPKTTGTFQFRSRVSEHGQFLRFSSFTVQHSYRGAEGQHAQGSSSKPVLHPPGQSLSLPQEAPGLTLSFLQSFRVSPSQPCGLCPKYCKMK